MGSSTIEYNGSGFEAVDDFVGVWLYFLIHEIDKRNPVPDWLREAREDWFIQAVSGYGYGVYLNLDHHLPTADRANLVIQLSEAAMEQLKQHDPFFTGPELNALRIDGEHVGGDGAYYVGDNPTETYVMIGELFMRLLKGQMIPSTDDARGDPSQSH